MPPHRSGGDASAPAQAASFRLLPREQVLTAACVLCADSRGSLVLEYSVFVSEDQPIWDACGTAFRATLPCFCGRHARHRKCCGRSVRTRHASWALRFFCAIHTLKSSVAGAGKILVRVANKVTLQEAAQLGRASFPVEDLAPGKSRTRRPPLRCACRAAERFACRA